MFYPFRNLHIGCVVAVLAIGVSTGAEADKIDDIISSGKLRCAVVLDYPPMGYRNAKNEPEGFDVEYCRDLAKALGVEPQIVETPFPDRIPALISDRADVGVASTSDTLERAKTIGFTIPYFVLNTVVLAREDASITKPDEIKGHPVGGVAGNYETIGLEANVKALNDPRGRFRAFQSQADVFLALSQKQIDATWVASTVAADIIKSGRYPGLKVVGVAPIVPDYVALIALRQEQGLLNYLNLFINQQVRSGRYNALYDKWVGKAAGDVPALTVPGVYR
ncbi:transporter substrate-binding domain-containing protein [Bradyrhizobium diazoefficiens]|uniref:transporter substrate-binding domain-containing protein n=1 Tax=Bradyrhizobium diazoefficiens TaxID=1355477 RepID=UPI00190D43EB|nr:transporter substrate-binding domain-containing protein [Bradyrhizobium diazoefficiens]QQO18041.1 transporter substrate-binding domain-containing protein [Bradyrhizobium diazoefficiens]